MDFILASSSKNRQKLLHELGYDFEIKIPDYAEIINPDLRPHEQVLEFAKGKALSAWNTEMKSPLIGLDSMIHFEGKSLGKPKSKAEAQNMIENFKGKWQEVITGVCVFFPGGDTQSFYEISKVKFRADISETELNDFLDTKIWEGKCGGYSVLSSGIKLIESIEGDFYNIIGIPILKLNQALRSR